MMRCRSRLGGGGTGTGTRAGTEARHGAQERVQERVQETEAKAGVWVKQNGEPYICRE